MACCANCIGDRYLRQQVIPEVSHGVGTCDFCGAVNASLVEPRELRDQFELLVAAYAPDAGGRTLVEWMKEEWAMFGHSALDLPLAQQLLAAILDEEEVVQRKFRPIIAEAPATLDVWAELRDELKWTNRFFPEAATRLDMRLPSWLELLSLDVGAENDPEWYRARIEEGSEAYGVDEMGAPPPERVTHGRANPPGIPYLYLSSTAETAVAEVRPHPGDYVDVAVFPLPADLQVIDLVNNPRVTASPFALEDEREIILLRGGLQLLEQLARELAGPVLPRAAAIDYVPTQYLCEFIKKMHYDGVLYRSSVGSGRNLALFDPEMSAARAVERRRTTSVLVTSEPV